MAPLLEMDASSAVVVGFGFSDAAQFSVPPGFGFLVPPGDSNLLLAGTFVDQKFEGRVPQGGRLVRAFFGGKAAERLMRCGNDEAAAVARLELARILGPLPEAQIIVVRRWPRSLPQYAVGHLERMKELDARVASAGRVMAVGNGYRGVGLPDLIRDARHAARQLAGQQYAFQMAFDRRYLTLASSRDSLFLIWCWEDGANPSLPRNCKRGEF
jgi:oxygen-dependent protoporphyrinogen oxidase